MKAGWNLQTLGKVCTFENGDRGENYPGRAAFVSEGIPIINAGHLSAAGINIDEMNFINRERFSLLRSGKIRLGDVLFCLRGSLGKFAVNDIYAEGAIASSLIIIRPTKQLDTGFLAAYLQSTLCAEMIRKYENGAAQPNLGGKSLEQFSIPIPPIDEQRHIVAVLDKAFAGIATATANAQKNLTNARAIFESYQSALFQEAGETVVPLGEMASFRNGLNFTGSSSGEKIRIVGVKDFQNRLWIPDENLAEVQIDGKLADTDILMEGDILTVRSNGNRELIGRCMVAPAMSAKTSHSGFTIRIRPNAEKVEPDFLCRILKSPQTRKRLVDGGNGASISSLNQQLLGSLPVPVPNKKKQIEIVGRIDEMTAYEDNLRVCINRKLNALTELKQSLLQKAFAGELT